METSSKDKACEVQESAVNAEKVSLNLGIGEFLTTQKDTAEVTLNPCVPEAFKSPMNFSSVTVEQLGITPESFVKSPAGKRKKASYLKKSRRRSTVGARGSPETNHLIRFIAQQRNLKSAEKSPLVQNSPLQRSPGLYQKNVNSLRERISAFQSVFYSIKENEKNLEHPEFSETEGFMTTNLTPKSRVGMCQKSEISAKSPKRRRLLSPNDENCTDTLDLQKFSIATSPKTDRTLAVENFRADPSEKSSETCLTQSGYLVEESIPLSDLTGTSNGIKVARCVQGQGAANTPDRFMDTNTNPAPEVRSMVSPLCVRNCPSSETVKLRSVLKKPSVKQFVEGLQVHCDNLCENEVHPNLISNLAKCCKERRSDQEDCKEPASVNLRKRKRVTFGEDLSPEVFDESLPANTPLRKGGTPVCKKNLGNISPHLDQSPVPEHFPQPNFDDKGENLENIEPLQVAFAVLSPLNKSTVSETLSGTDTFSSSNNCENISPRKGARVTRTSSRRSQSISFAEENVCNLLNTEVQPCKEKKTKRRKSQESKCSDKVRPKKNRALKSCRKKRGRPKKAVQKSLYGERDIASKKPLLSPIPELPEFLDVMPSFPSFQRMESDDFTSNGELAEVQLPKINTLLPENPEDLQVNQGFNCDVPEFRSSYVKSSTALDTTTFDQDLNTDTREVNTNENIPKAETILERGKELKGGTENNSLISCASLMEQPVDLGGLEPALLCQPQEFSVSSQNVGNLSQIFKISEDEYVKCEKQDDFLVAAAGKLQTKHLMTDAQKDFDCSDVLADKMKESQSEELGRSSAESSRGSCRDRKQRRRSQCFSGGQSLPLEKERNQQPCVTVETNLENLELNSELYKDLCDSIEQTFQRASSKTKVRRSTRLQKDLENKGLVWVSPPSCTSQKTKRRTVSTFDSSGYENLSSSKETAFSGQTLWVPPIIPSKENSIATSSDLPGKRRKSFCTSVLENRRNTTQSKRRMHNHRGEKSSNDPAEI
ncbi:cell division cycle-associated protein 2 [Sorex fumeus]|uniref:cell division cycle-associated protein 2 n=1 Tax=Sorex fumeus TaxID=62283 RepID=UPI0024AD9DF7|nr:cell division cycle-associated protein 2 [Sorex fumeus]